MQGKQFSLCVFSQAEILVTLVILNLDNQSIAIVLENADKIKTLKSQPCL